MEYHVAEVRMKHLRTNSGCKLLGKTLLSSCQVTNLYSLEKRWMRVVRSQFQAGSPMGLWGNLLRVCSEQVCVQTSCGPQKLGEWRRQERVDLQCGCQFLSPAHLLQASLFLGDVSQLSGEGSLPAYGTSLKAWAAPLNGTKYFAWGDWEISRVMVEGDQRIGAKVES